MSKKKKPDLTIERTAQGFAVVGTQTGLTWRTLPTRSAAEAWLDQAVAEEM